MMDRYDIADRTCPICGALIGGREPHTDWHAAAETRIHRQLLDINAKLDMMTRHIVAVRMP